MSFLHPWFARIIILLCAPSLMALELKGDFVQGGLLFGQLAPKQTVFFDGKLIPTTSDHKFIIGLDRDFAEKLSITVVSASGEVTQEYDIAKRDYKLQKIEGIAKTIMSPSAESIARSRKENSLVAKARRERSMQPYYEAGFTWPLLGPITGVYGSQRVYNGVPKRPHYGVDVAAPTGTPVTAPAPGIVRLAYENMFFSGGTLVIDHGFDLSSSFLHLSEILVSEGDYVDSKTVVALVGATGRVTGPHLDWRMNWGKQRIDPQLLVPPMELFRKENSK